MDKGGLTYHVSIGEGGHIIQVVQVLGFNV